MIALSSGLAASRRSDRLSTHATYHLWAVAAPRCRLRRQRMGRPHRYVGRRIGSAASVADGLHARTDGFTSLAVLLGAGGVSRSVGAGPTPPSGCSSPSRSSAYSAPRVQQVGARADGPVDRLVARPPPRGQRRRGVDELRDAADPLDRHTLRAGSRHHRPAKLTVDKPTTSPTTAEATYSPSSPAHCGDHPRQPHRRPLSRRAVRADPYGPAPAKTVAVSPMAGVSATKPQLGGGQIRRRCTRRIQSDDRMLCGGSIGLRARLDADVAILHAPAL